jgi:branched-subunit amino acid aminotransferase/4-amino-4-deoxychorismate lyase
MTANLTRAADFSLVETILWEPCCGIWLLPEHLLRLRLSAAHFSFAYEEDRLLCQLDEIAGGLAQHAHIIRVLINLRGDIQLSADPASPDNRPVRAALAKHAIDPTNIFLYHSTTNRQVYDQAKAERQEVGEVILWNNRGEVTESCTSNLIVEIDGQYYTPPVEAGLLPGTYRAHLLAEGNLTERPIAIDALPNFSKIYLVNAAIGWREVILDP